MQPVIEPIDSSSASATTSGGYRSDDEEKQGTPASSARSKIATASLSEPAKGLSMNNGLPAAITGRACSRCGRPSTLSRKTTSTRSSNASMESTISTS